MSAVRESVGMVDRRVVEAMVVTRAAHLRRLLSGLENGPRRPGPYLTAEQVFVAPPAQVIVNARGKDRVGELVEIGADELVVEYLAATGVQQARASAGLYPGLGDPDYADRVARRARAGAESQMERWRSWATTDPARLADNGSARAMWQRIEPGHEQASAHSAAPALAATLARHQAVAALRRHSRQWPLDVYRRAYLAAYVRHRIATLHPSAPWLAWITVHRVSVPRARVRVVVAQG